MHDFYAKIQQSYNNYKFIKVDERQTQSITSFWAAVPWGELRVTK